MFQTTFKCYGDSEISYGCKNCIFDKNISNGNKCIRCTRNTEISDEMKEKDLWVDNSRYWDYFDLRT